MPGRRGNYIYEVEGEEKMRFSQIGFLLSVIIHLLLLSIPFNVMIRVPSQPQEKKIDLVFEKPKPPPKPKLKTTVVKKVKEKKEESPQLKTTVVKKVKEKKEETPPPQGLSPIESEVVGDKGIDIPTGKVYEEPYIPLDKPEPPKPKPEPKPKVDKAEILRQYQALVIGKIRRNKKYPAWAKREDFEGRAYVKFTIFSSGQAANISISSSSGFSILDKEAISTVKRASPFPPLPKELNLPQLNFKLSVVFELK